MSSEVAAKTTLYGLIVCWWLFILTFWLRKAQPAAKHTKRDGGSYAGLFLQALAYFALWLGPVEHGGLTGYVGSGRPEWLAWTIAAIALVIAAGSVGLVVWAARRLGKQWSLGARVVENHVLIESGPYALVRNPIYAGMFGMLLATGLAVGNWLLLALALVLFAAGTCIRVRLEERLLREAFGTRFEDYARRVPALLPGIY